MIIFTGFGFHMDSYSPLVLTLNSAAQPKWCEANLLFDRHTFDVLSELSDWNRRFETLYSTVLVLATRFEQSKVQANL